MPVMILSSTYLNFDLNDTQSKHQTILAMFDVMLLGIKASAD